MRMAIIVIALALASPSWGKDWSDAAFVALRACQDDAVFVSTPEENDVQLGKLMRDPWDVPRLFSCMLDKGFRYCRNCASTTKQFCHRRKFAPLDHKCWESTTFPAPHQLGEMP